jgi:hypothetical protein
MIPGKALVPGPIGQIRAQQAGTKLASVPGHSGEALGCPMLG